MPLSTQSAYADTSRPSSTSIRVLAPGSTTTTTRIGPNNSVEDAPTYAPWSQDQFLGRLETFADVKLWTTKPEPLSDVYWARRGWIAIGLDEVACRTCGKHMLVRIDAGGADDQEQENDEDGDEQAWWQTGVEQDYVDKYEKLIIDGHTQDCLWRKSGCKGKFYNNPKKYLSNSVFQQMTFIELNSQIPHSGSLNSQNATLLSSAHHRHYHLMLRTRWRRRNPSPTGLILRPLLPISNAANLPQQQCHQQLTKSPKMATS